MGIHRPGSLTKRGESSEVTGEIEREEGEESKVSDFLEGEEEQRDSFFFSIVELEDNPLQRDGLHTVTRLATTLLLVLLFPT